MPPDHEKLPSAWGCGWRYGAEAGCAILSCRCKSPCEGKWAEQIYQILANYGRGPADDQENLIILPERYPARGAVADFLRCSQE